MDLGIEGKVALVTGGSRGLGKQAAMSLAKEGVHVVICARTESTLYETVDHIRKMGGHISGFVADISQTDERQKLYESVIEENGNIDILVNNAGGSVRGDIVSTTDQQWKDLLDLNLISAIEMSRLVIPEMKEKEWGRIINVASIWGREYGGGAAYMTTKAALIALTKNTALDYAKHGILVNCVAPGSIEFAGGSWDRFQQNQPKDVVESFVSQNLPMGKFGWPEPVGDLITFLSSENLGILTGACINIDGGQSKSLI
ncbi:MAG: SDR family oxidoreductase [Chloroflexota bacterium]|nr:SDR family oxidoreductase [Chloroflexota bacterium]